MSKSRLTVSSLARRFLLRPMVVFAILRDGGIALFSAAPISFSIVMVERQASAWSHGNFRYVAHSNWVDMDQILLRMGPAVIVVEGQKLLEHWGFDIASIEWTLAHNGRNENRIHDVSTVSQQAAKNLFLWDGRSWTRKGLGAGLTLGVEAVWSKKHALTVYLNAAEFGDGVFGVGVAAQRYFHKPASKFIRLEAALLTVILPNPPRLKVSVPSGYMHSCQAWILRQIYQLGGESLMQQRQLG